MALVFMGSSSKLIYNTELVCLFDNELQQGDFLLFFSWLMKVGNAIFWVGAQNNTLFLTLSGIVSF